MAKVNKQFLTCVFRLHDPSAWKRKVLDDVMTAYTNGVTDLLEWSKHNIDHIRADGVYAQRGKYTEKSISQVMPGSGQIKMPVASCLKESAIQHVAAAMASYLELEKMDDESPSMPTGRDTAPDADYTAMRDLAGAGIDIDAENDAVWRMKRLAKSRVSPVHFVRSRDFRILADTEKNRFFGLLKLLPARSGINKRTIIQDGNLIDINTGAPFKYRGDAAILFPLEVGQRGGENHWQYNEFIYPTLTGRASIQSAKLVRKDGEKHEYFLHVSFAFECPTVYEPQAFLGIDKGIMYSMAYAIVGHAGQVLKMHHEEDGLRSLATGAGERIQRLQKRGKRVDIRFWKRREQEAVIHRMVNQIIAEAKAHKASIVVEDLNIKVRGKFVKSAFAKMDKILTYKCNLAGVPFRGGVFAAYTSQICIHCGELCDRPERGTVICPHCGKSEHADEAAAVNIARRTLYRKKDWEKKGGYRAFHRSFATLPAFRAENELRKAA